jgi:hypothetical protein
MIENKINESLHHQMPKLLSDLYSKQLEEII